MDSFQFTMMWRLAAAPATHGRRPSVGGGHASANTQWACSSISRRTICATALDASSTISTPPCPPRLCALCA